MTNTTPDGRRLPPNGTCHDCGRPVTGERRYCGRCVATRDSTPDRRARHIEAQVIAKWLVQDVLNFGEEPT